MSRFGVSAVLGCALCLAAGVARAQGYSVVGGGGRTGAGASAGEAAPAGGARAGATAGSGAGSAATSGEAGVSAGGGGASVSATAPGSGGVAPAGGGSAIIRRRGGGGGGEDDGSISLGAPHHPWDYGGVVPPGNGVVPPGFTRGAVRRAGNRVLVAWPGFQMTEGGSRIFLAVNRTPQISVSRGAGRLVYRLSNAMVPVRNNRRALETRAFETPVSRAYLRQRGRDVELVIELRAAAEPQVTQQAGAQGLGFVYLDFGRWSPPREAGTEGPSISGEEQGSGRAGGAGTPANTPPTRGVGTGVRPAASGGAIDTERPPPVRR